MSIYVKKDWKGNDELMFEMYKELSLYQYNIILHKTLLSLWKVWEYDKWGLSLMWFEYKLRIELQSHTL